MNTTLAVVVSAIVILITALVVITIFSGGVGQVGSLTNAKTICETQGRSSCTSTGQMPLTWNIPTVNVNGQQQSCDTATGVHKCSGFSGITLPQSAGGITYTCANTPGQSCTSGASCQLPKTSGTGTCPEGQVCCK